MNNMTQYGVPVGEYVDEFGDLEIEYEWFDNLVDTYNRIATSDFPDADNNVVQIG